MSDYPETKTSTSKWWDERASKMDTEIAASAVKSPEDRLYYLCREAGSIDAAYGPGSDKANAEHARINAEIVEIEAEIAIAFAAEWTAEVTDARRAEYNAAAIAGEDAYYAWSRTSKWTREDLVKAVALYK
jgi:hypothetical protein